MSLRSAVSVVVTTYNQAPYIYEALESVHAQTYAPLEVLVVDDGSTDGTRERIEDFGDRVSPLFQPNQGVAASRNTGVRRARGELIAFLDGDDVWNPEKLAVQVEVAKRNPGSGLVAVDGVEFDATGVIRPSLFLGDLFDRLYAEDELEITDSFYPELLRGSFIGTMSQVMIPSRVLADVGPSDTSLRVASDYDLFLRIAAKYPFTCVKQPLVSWRCVETSASGPRHLRFRWGEEDVLVLAKQLREGSPEKGPLIRRELKWRLSRTAQRAYFYGLEHDRSWARRFLARFFLRHPRCLHALAYLVALCVPPGLVHLLAPAVRRVLPERARGPAR